jgi:hypothetical protein
MIVLKTSTGVDTNPMEREIFQRAGCLYFYLNMQRGHPEVEK